MNAPRYTLLLLTGDGIVLRDYHARRLGLDPQSAPFARFAADAEPGVFAVWSDHDGAIRAERRGGSRLRDGMEVRFLPSPLDRAGLIAKLGSPCIYDGVRTPGVATLLTSTDGSEIYEACRAAVIGWDGERIVVAPLDRPRVWSTAAAAIADHLPVRDAPLRAGSDSLLMVNAVKGTCALDAPHGSRFPAGTRREIEALFAALTMPPG
jgi:hypothetical protein